jgi:hypothetical protein
MFPEKYHDNQNIGPFKYRFRLSIFQINYSIDKIDYRLSHGLKFGDRQSLLVGRRIFKTFLVILPRDGVGTERSG